MVSNGILGGHCGIFWRFLELRNGVMVQSSRLVHEGRSGVEAAELHWVVGNLVSHDGEVATVHRGPVTVDAD